VNGLKFKDMKTKLLFILMSVGMVLPLTAQNIPSYVPTNGLVGCWPFNGNANDESGNGNNLSIQGMVSFENDRFNNINSSVKFDELGEFLFLESPKLPSGNSQRTVSLWFKSTNITYNEEKNSIPFTYGDITQNAVCYDRFTLEIYEKNIYFHGKCSDYTWSTDSLYNTWVHLVYVYDPLNNRASLYKNGRLLNWNYSGLTSSLKTPLGQLKIGTGINEWYNESQFNGLIDEVSVWDRCLSIEEVKNLYVNSIEPIENSISSKVYVDAPSVVNQNDTLELSISSEGLNSIDNIISYQTDFTYDSTRFTFLSDNLSGTLNSNGNVAVNSSKNGVLNISYMSQSPISGSGKLMNLKFKANNNIGSGIFNLSNFLFNTSTVTQLKSDTVNIIDGISPTARVSFSMNPVRKGDSLLITVNFSEKMADSPVPQISLTGQNTLESTNLTRLDDSTYTFWWLVEKGNGEVYVTLGSCIDLAGNNIIGTPTENPSFTIIPTLFGDIDTNKLVQAYDAALALQYSVGLDPLPTMDPLPWSNWRLSVANVDTVGSVTANDASLILQHSAKLLANFPADEKKRGGDAPIADVTISKEGNQLVFRATGTLYGFNLSFKDNFESFGQPEVKDKNVMLAKKINVTTYNVGLASTKPLIENEPFLIIPIISNNEVNGNADVVINTIEKSMVYGSSAKIDEETTTEIIVYPNPTSDILIIYASDLQALSNYKYSILDMSGKEVYNALVEDVKTEISLKSIGSKGTYVLHIIDANGNSINENKIVLE